MQEKNYAFVTYFDSNYLVKGVAMLVSLHKHESNAKLYAVCLDDLTYKIIASLQLENVIPVRLSAIEAGDQALATARGNRSKVEYYWTLTPVIIGKLLKGMPSGSCLVYVDADLYFFSPVLPVIEEMAEGSVLIHKHNFPPIYQKHAANGVYNVGMMIFRNDEEGKKVLAWWRDRCLEWCYNRCENGKMGDQKYLESFQHLSGRVIVTNNVGVCVAPWNGIGYRIRQEADLPLVNDTPVVCFHFHATAYLAQGCMMPSTDIAYTWTIPMLELFARPYLESLDSSLQKVRGLARDFSLGFKTEGLSTLMCVVARSGLADALANDYPCQFDLSTGFIACGAPQIAENDEICGKTIHAGCLSWSGNYRDWQSAEAAAGGYDSEEIVAKAVEAARAVRDGKALWERDTVLFHKPEINWPLYAALMSVAARNNGELHVLDFGGALGSTFIQHKKWLEPLPACTWHIVEQEAFVQAGQREFTTDKLSFHYQIEDALANGKINCVLLSSVLQYLEKPFDLLRKLAKSKLPIIIDRTSFHDAESRLTVQRVGEELYKASYPCWWLDKNRIVHLLTNSGYILSPFVQCNFAPDGFFGFFAFI